MDNTRYSADIATSYTDGTTKLLTSGGVEATVTIYKAVMNPQQRSSTRMQVASTTPDNSRTAANEDSYTMTPKDGVMQDDRVLGEISSVK